MEILCREHIRQFPAEEFRLPSQSRSDTGLFAWKSSDDKTGMLTRNVIARLSSGIVDKRVQVQTMIGGQSVIKVEAFVDFQTFVVRVVRDISRFSLSVRTRIYVSLEIVIHPCRIHKIVRCM